MKLLLVSNYAPDRQESMLRFSALLRDGLSERGHDVTCVQPAAIVGRLLPRGHPLTKWAGYLDKLVLFPPRLRLLSASFDVAHVCDHSNAPCQGWLKSRAVVATCHDLLAVRGALGEETYCPASGMGKRLQASILRSLAAISHVACDSDATRADFSRLTGRMPGSTLRTILLGFSDSFRRPSDEVVRQELLSHNLGGLPYVLHVGSSQPRKNREGVLRSVARLGHQWAGLIVFVGEPLRQEQRKLAADLGVAGRVRELGALSDASLASIYAGAHALMFPSFCEGFGWPLLEAQACDCPVITADNTSLKEVAGEGALVFDARDEEGLSQAILRLGIPSVREACIDSGRSNLERFTLNGMLDAYETLYREALANAR